MPVNSYHPDFTQKLKRWEKQRHAIEGEDAVREHASRYLDKPEGFESKHFTRYVNRAKWYGATARTVGALSGSIMQKEPEVMGSSGFMRDSSNITLSGITLEGFASSLLDEVILKGRYGVLSDYSEPLRRSYWSGFPPECIINWRTENINGEEKLILVVLHEKCETIGNDYYDLVYRNRYRVAFLNEEGSYQVDIHEELPGEGQRMALINSLIPQRRGEPLDFIPFQFFGADDLTPLISKGPLDDLVNVNFSYYRHSADYEHGLYLTGIPTPVITGHTNTNEVLAIGSMTAWILPEPEAKVYFLQYESGGGLEALERAMAVDKQEMATLGARLLEDQPGVAETLGAVQLRHSGDTGSLRSIADLTSQGLTNLVRWHHWRNGETELIQDERYSINLNTDFSAATMNPQDLIALFTVLQGGGISQETFLYNLQQGERLPPGVSIEDEIRRISIAEPARLPFRDETESDVA